MEQSEEGRQPAGRQHWGACKMLLLLLGLLASLRPLPAAFLYDPWSSHCHTACICNSALKLVTCHGPSPVNSTSFLDSIPTDVSELVLTSWQFSRLSIDLQQWPHLKVLRLSANGIQNLKMTTMGRKHGLQELYVNRNMLTSISFLENLVLGNLQILDTSENLLKNVPLRTFQHFDNLREVYLGKNRLQQLPLGIFDSSRKIEVFKAENNELNHIHPFFFRNLTGLKLIHLQNNKLTMLVNGTLENLINLSEVQIHENPFECNCALKWLHNELERNSIYSYVERIKCHSADDKWVSVLELGEEDLQCQHPYLQAVSGHQSVYYLHQVTLWCNATGVPQPAVYWITPRGQWLSHPSNHPWVTTQLQARLQPSFTFSVGAPTFYQSRAVARADGSLHIDQMRSYFAGHFICVAENPQGQVNSSINLVVISMMPYTFVSTVLVGGGAAGGFLLLGIIIGSLRWGVEWLLNQHGVGTHSKKASSGNLAASGVSTPSYYQHSPPTSPLKCNTPISLESIEEDHVTFPSNIRETLEDVRIRLRSGMERQVGRIRSRAQHVRQAGSHYIQTVKESGSHYMQSIRESGSQYMHTIRSSSSQYASRVRAGVVLGVEQVKYHVQSMKELCGTGDLGHTVSTVSISTNVDTQEQRQVVKSITIV